MQTSASIRRKPSEIRDWPLVNWWIRVTSPAPDSPAYGRNPQWREEVASLFCFIMILQILIPIPAAIQQLPNPTSLIALLIALGLRMAAVFLKRIGRIGIAGILIVFTSQVTLLFAALGPGKLDIVSMRFLDMLIEPTVAAIIFFPPISILCFCLLNCFLIFSIIEFTPHAAVLNQQFTENFVATLTDPMQLQIFTALASFIMIRALLKEIRRADNAEELAHLRQSEAELRKREAKQAQQLEEGIQLILQALNTATVKGDFSMRVPLAQENILWRVGYSINNLLARLQGFKQEKAELEKTRAVASQLAECLRQGQSYPLNQWTGTSLDQLIVELNKHLNGQKTHQINQ